MNDDVRADLDEETDLHQRIARHRGEPPRLDPQTEAVLRELLDPPDRGSDDGS